MKRFLILFLTIQVLVGTMFSLAQSGYRDEMGREISQEYFEKQIIEGPYFGIPHEAGGEVLVHRMPFGKVDYPKLFFEKTGNLEAFESGLSLIVIYYPGKDECNSTGLGNNASSFKKEHATLIKWAEKDQAAPPVYLYSKATGIGKYPKVISWSPDPDQIFAQQFFKFPYPCGSFVVIHPSGNFRAILGEYPLSQIQVALKNLNRDYN
jgi:hypothetical protein